MIIIIGAGMAGLLAGVMLRDAGSVIMEARPSLPNNHSAVLRFRSTIVADTLGIEFKRVEVIKAAEPYLNPVADALAYSAKTGGIIKSDRSITKMAGSGEVVTRYIAPKDLVNIMASRIESRITYNSPLIDLSNRAREADPIISTIPMPALMDVLGWPEKPKFIYQEGENIIVKLRDVDAYASLYIPDPNFPGARVSVTGDEMIVEVYRDCPAWDTRDIATVALSKMGIPKDKLVSFDRRHQTYAKILPIDEDLRKRFMMWASRERGVYSLGRYATWRPGLLLDDLVNDVRVIRKLIQRDSTAYEYSK